MSVKWDVVDSLAGLSEDLKVEGNFVARIHDEVKKIRDERDALRADNADLLARLDAAAFAAQHGLREVAERQKAAMLAAINDDSYANYDGAEVVSILKAVPLVTEENK